MRCSRYKVFFERMDSGDFVAPDRIHSARAHRQGVLSMRFTRTNRLVTCGGDGQVKSWELQVALNPKFAPFSAVDMAVSPGGETIAVAGVKALRLANKEGGMISRHEPGNADYQCVALSRDGKLLAGLNRDVVELRKFPSLEELHRFSLGSAPT